MIDQDMSQLEFSEIVKDVSSFFGAPRDRQMEILYDVFKAYPYDLMKRACRFLIENHDHRFFPSPREIHDALREVAETKTPAAGLEDSPDAGYERCHECGGVGMMVEYRSQGEYSYQVAVYCECPKGRRIKQGHRQYMIKNHTS